MRRSYASGDKFNKLTAIEFVEYRNKRSYWLFTCDCGQSVVADSWAVSRGKRGSCGCTLRPNRLTHGKTRTPEYNSWGGIKNRCYNIRNPKYPRYGGRGITVCDRWKDSFENFFADMGLKPSSEHSIDRINNDGDYTPDNCRWATPKEQANNMSRCRNITHNGKTMTGTEWSKKLKLPCDLVNRRVKDYGWSEEKAVTTPHLQPHRLK